MRKSSRGFGLFETLLFLFAIAIVVIVVVKWTHMDRQPNPNELDLPTALQENVGVLRNGRLRPAYFSQPIRLSRVRLSGIQRRRLVVYPSMTVRIVTSDLHLTDKPADAYRFGIFDWLARQVDDYGADEVLILGDLTDAKDKHSAVLVNKITAGIRTIVDETDVVVLKGNHDYVDPAMPFFLFLGDAFERVTYINTPTVIGDTLYIPHRHGNGATQYIKDAIAAAGDPQFIFLHQTVHNSRASSGMLLDGMFTSAAMFGNAKVVAGDVHVPQLIGGLTYVGSPYQVRYGDDFTPRVMLMDGRSTRDLSFDAPKKQTITITHPDKLKAVKGLRDGDMVKIRLSLPPAELVDWQKYRQQVVNYCEKAGWVLGGVELIKGDGGSLRAAEDGGIDVETATPRHTTVEDLVTRYSNQSDRDKETYNLGIELTKESAC